MLADILGISVLPPSGRLDPDVHLPCTAKLELVDYIAEELPRWRDYPRRPSEDAETTLTGQ